MIVDTEYIYANDGQKILLRRWLPETPRAVVVLAHGMTEHSQRYDDFGRFLAGHGIGLYCHDQRGHGVTAVASNTLGYLPVGTGWPMMISDIQQIVAMVRQQFATPVFLMGHSMGSFLVRRTMQLTPSLADGVIISGTGADSGVIGCMGIGLAWGRCGLFGEKENGQMLQKLSFGQFNQQFKPTRTPFDWLSSDPVQVDQYMADPLCGFTCTNGFFYELFRNVKTVNQTENVKHVDLKIPIFLFSGNLDPVGDMGKGVTKVYLQYKQAGVKDLTMKLYSDGRHEMLNEVNKEAVYHDIMTWLDNHLE